MLIKMLLKLVLVEGSKDFNHISWHHTFHNPWLKIDILSSTELTAKKKTIIRMMGVIPSSPPT